MTTPLALVTGAAGGIGAAVVRRLRAGGMRILAVDRNADGVAALARDLGEGVVPVAFDLTDIAGTPAFLAELVTRHRAVTRLVLGAGVWPGAPIVDMSDELWNLNFTVNVTSPFAFLRALAPQMAAAGGGAVVAIASRNAQRSSVNNAAYDASKAALVALVRTAAGELARHHIRVNAVSPGVISTPATAEVEEPRFKTAYLKQIPLDRYGTPADIAGLCAFLLSDDAAFLTGQDVVVDGGQLACQDNGRFMEIPGLGAGGTPREAP